MPRATRPTPLALGVLTAVLVGLAACGSDATTSPADQVQTLAQAGLLQSYTATYAVAKADGTKSDSVTVWRTPNRLRLDVKTAAGVSSSITSPDRTVACQQPSGGKKPTCLVVAGPAKAPPAAFDPVLRKVFGDVLRVLAAPDNGLQVVATEPTDTPSAYPTATPSGLGEVRCFLVSGPPSSTVAKGTYCLDANGVPVSLIFESASATMTSFTPGAPAAATFVPEVSPTALPTTPN